MLRGLVLLLIGLNVALFFWIRSDPAWTQADRDPQRLGQEVAPQSIRFVAGPPASMPASAAASGAASSASAAAGAASAASTASADPAGATATTVALETGPAGDGPCVESAPLPVAQATALQHSLDGSGIPATAVGYRVDPQPAYWMVYLGRFPDANAWQRKADELHRLDVPAMVVTHPASLAPGLSLGSHATAAEAEAHLAALAKRGVHTARVVTVEADPNARRVQVRVADAALQRKLPTERFSACHTI
jgi:hypothetical protein